MKIMNRCGNRNLNMFHPTKHFYYNYGVCQYKRGATSFLYIFLTIFSDCDIIYHFTE
jgi:hypothetical protein